MDTTVLNAMIQFSLNSDFDIQFQFMGFFFFFLRGCPVFTSFKDLYSWGMSLCARRLAVHCRVPIPLPYAVSPGPDLASPDAITGATRRFVERREDVSVREYGPFLIWKPGISPQWMQRCSTSGFWTSRFDKFSKRAFWIVIGLEIFDSMTLTQSSSANALPWASNGKDSALEAMD